MHSSAPNFANRMGVRHVPELSFAIDRSAKMTGRMDELLGRMRKRDEKRKSAAPAPEVTSQSMTHEASIAELLKTFRSTKSFLITSHARPDGDAIGSALALSEILTQLGCQTRVIMADPPPFIYQTLPGIDSVEVNPDIEDKHTPAIVLECDSILRTGLKCLEGRHLINIDHHASGRPYANLNWIDEHACAVAELVYRIAIAADVEITPSMATCLYAAILSDTGSFTYPSTNATTFEIAHDLAAHGASPSSIARNLYFTNPESKVRLLAVALSNMQCDGAIAWSWVTDAEMQTAGATPEDCEGVVNYLIGIAGVESAVFPCAK